ncbi:MAG: ATP-binding protein [Chloroflexota bacterium]|nr:ATP-binding protein [Chloroflexota bacterium]
MARSDPTDDNGAVVTSTPGTDDAAFLRPEDLGIGRLFWTMRDAVVVGEVSTGRIVLWNPAAERLFGWPAAAVLGSSIERLVPEYLRTEHRAGLARYAATGHGPLVDTGRPVELPALRRDGTEITIELTLTPLVDDAAGAQPTYVLAFVRDATERTHLARERAAVLAAARDYTRRLEELATLKADFTAMVAHELSAPVAAIRALADLLERGAVPAADQPSVLTTLRAEADLVSRLVRDVGSAAAVEREDFAIQPRPVPVATIVADAAGCARLLPGDHPFEETVAGDMLTAQVLADPERIGQVLHNLLGNAAKHTPVGTPIRLHVGDENGRVRFDVVDAGPGIPAEEHERILRKFGRSRDTEQRGTPGSGLGLYLARRILRAHDTDLEIATEPGAGSRFGFTLERVT